MARLQIETDVLRNVKHVQSVLGIVLIASFVFFVWHQIEKSLTGLNDSFQNIYTDVPNGVSGSIHHIEKENPVLYSTFVSFYTTAHGVSKNSALFITLTCFQGEQLVYQRTAQAGTRFLLKDQYESGFSWDGKTASCSAVLLYRVRSGDSVNVYLLDSTSFNVVESATKHS